MYVLLTETVISVPYLKNTPWTQFQENYFFLVNGNNKKKFFCSTKSYLERLF